MNKKKKKIKTKKKTDNIWEPTTILFHKRKRTEQNPYINVQVTIFL